VTEFLDIFADAQTIDVLVWCSSPILAVMAGAVAWLVTRLPAEAGARPIPGRFDALVDHKSLGVGL
jgi:hypothetical protein